MLKPLVHSNVIDFIASKAHERMEKLQYEIVNHFPSIQQIQEPVDWGVFSWTLKKSKRRILKKSGVVYLCDIPQTVSEVARLYLDFYHKNRLRATRNAVHIYKEGRTPPLYCMCGVYESVQYVDLKAAYFSIMLKYGWNVDYFPGKWLVTGRPPSDFPLREHKVARNCLVSAGMSGTSTLWTGSKFVYKKTRNLHINMGLFRLVCDILHDIASYSIRLGAVYVNTDGYILPDRKSDELRGYIKDRYGFSTAIKAIGTATIMGAGNYMVGNTKTKGFRPVAYPRNIDYVMNLTPREVRCIQNCR